ncbi:hypothetical protein B0H17DRAFT_1131054 [Mycena rosella]|uniref:Uncharacterized protein n=1 Tax=Mycena rosella TaxID=1033263 RepID=A0AAD7DRW2_MYCRO|nr:hypothetical protein B0H17DRAFT_1131054 [Mycena rosella]
MNMRKDFEQTGDLRHASHDMYWECMRHIAIAQVNKYLFFKEMPAEFDQYDALVGHGYAGFVCKARNEGRYTPGSAAPMQAKYRHENRPVFFTGTEIQIIGCQFKNHFATVMGKIPASDEFICWLDNTAAVTMTSRILKGDVVERHTGLSLSQWVKTSRSHERESILERRREREEFTAKMFPAGQMDEIEPWEELMRAPTPPAIFIPPPVPVPIIASSGFTEGKWLKQKELTGLGLDVVIMSETYRAGKYHMRVGRIGNLLEHVPYKACAWITGQIAGIQFRSVRSDGTPFHTILQSPARSAMDNMLHIIQADTLNQLVVKDMILLCKVRVSTYVHVQTYSQQSRISDFKVGEELHRSETRATLLNAVLITSRSMKPPKKSDASFILDGSDVDPRVRHSIFTY